MPFQSLIGKDIFLGFVFYIFLCMWISFTIRSISVAKDTRNEFSLRRRKRENWDVMCFAFNATNVPAYCEYYNGKNGARYGSMMPSEVK